MNHDVAAALIRVCDKTGSNAQHSACHLFEKLAGLAEAADVNQHAAELYTKLSAQRIVDTELLKRYYTRPNDADRVLQTAE